MTLFNDSHLPLAIQQGEYSCGHQENARIQAHSIQTGHDDCRQEGSQESFTKKAAPQGAVGFQCAQYQQEGDNEIGQA